MKKIIVKLKNNANNVEKGFSVARISHLDNLYPDIIAFNNDDSLSRLQSFCLNEVSQNVLIIEILTTF